MKALNATGMVGTPKGDQWKVLVSMSIEGELISDTLTNSQVRPSASTHLNTHLSRLDNSESIAILQEAKAT